MESTHQLIQLVTGGPHIVAKSSYIQMFWLGAMPPLISSNFYRCPHLPSRPNIRSVEQGHSKPLIKSNGWLVLGLPLWKIWVRQLGWLDNPNINGKIKLMATKPPTSNGIPKIEHGSRRFCSALPTRNTATSLATNNHKGRQSRHSWRKRRVDVIHRARSPPRLLESVIVMQCVQILNGHQWKMVKGCEREYSMYVSKYILYSFYTKLQGKLKKDEKGSLGQNCPTITWYSLGTMNSGMNADENHRRFWHHEPNPADRIHVQNSFEIPWSWHSKHLVCPYSFYESPTDINTWGSSTSFLRFFPC